MRIHGLGLATSLFNLMLGWSVAATAAPAPTKPNGWGPNSSGTSPAGAQSALGNAANTAASPSAGAQDNAPPAPAPVPSPGAQQEHPENAALAPAPVGIPRQLSTPLQPAATKDPWQMDFERAKNAFILGQFAAAEVQLKQVLLRANNPVDKARVEEILAACHAWTRRGATLVEQHELQGSDVLSRRTDRRTSDEIGVLYLSSIAYGLGAGVWIDVLANPNDITGAVLPPLLLAGASAGTVAIIDQGRGLRYGAAQSISTGMWLGLWQGVAWGTYFQATSNHYDQMTEGSYATLLFGTTTAGAVAGGLVGTLSKTTPGRAAFVGSTALWPAVVLGLGMAGLTADDDRRDDRAMLAAAFGLTAGTVAGVLVAGDVAPTTARVRFLDLGAIAGGLAFGGLALAAAGNDAKLESTTLMTDVGVVAGLGIAWWLTADMPKDTGAAASRSSVTLIPTLAPQRGGMGLGVTGLF